MTDGPTLQSWQALPRVWNWCGTDTDTCVVRIRNWRSLKFWKVLIDFAAVQVVEAERERALKSQHSSCRSGGWENWEAKVNRRCVKDDENDDVLLPICDNVIAGRYQTKCTFYPRHTASTTNSFGRLRLRFKFKFKFKLEVR